MSGITTHVLDTARGRPAEGVPVRLERAAEEGWIEVAEAETDADGRVTDLHPGPPEVAPYRLTFDTAAYFGGTGVHGFYPEVTVHFVVERPEEHYHVPLLLNPFGYSTYRGS